MKKVWQCALNRLDEQLVLAHSALVPERPALLVFMFHVLSEDATAMTRNLVDPQQRITVQVFTEFVAYH